MVDSPDFDALASEIFVLLHKYGLTPKSLGISLLLPRPEFDVIATKHPGHHHRMILLGKGNEWYMKIQPEVKLEDLPPGAILPPQDA